jgi:hypothetical protein
MWFWNKNKACEVYSVQLGGTSAEGIMTCINKTKALNETE